MSAKPQHVVVAYDFSPLGRVVLERAVALVSRAPFHVLHFLTVVDPSYGVPVLRREGHIDYEYADKVRDLILADVKGAFGGADIPAEIHLFIHARIGKPTDEILGLAEDVGADLILLGTHGFTGFQRLVMGSTAERVVRESGCPVLVVRPKTYPDIQLAKITETPGDHPRRSQPYRLSYTNHNVVMRPPEWPIG